MKSDPVIPTQEQVDQLRSLGYRVDWHGYGERQVTAPDGSVLGQAGTLTDAWTMAHNHRLGKLANSVCGECVHFHRESETCLHENKGAIAHCNACPAFESARCEPW